MNANKTQGVIWTLGDVRSSVWAIVPDVLDHLVVNTNLGVASDAAPLEAGQVEAKAKQLPSARGTIAVLPLRGVITQHGFGGFLDVLFGGTRLDAWGEAFDGLVADESIAAIVLDIDSPGGSVYGVTEMAAKIRAARDVKPVVALANSTAASAAYAIGSAAGTLVVTPSGLVGSIGVLNVHVDTTAAEEAAGIKTTITSSGEYKAEGWTTLDDEAKAAIQARIDAYYATFLGDVAKGRGVTAKVVKETYGKGRLVNAADALAAGMVDRVATLQEVLAGMSKSKTPRRDHANRRARMMEMEECGE